MVTETTIGDFKGFDPAGPPEFYRIRKAVQYSDSIDSWLAVMMDHPNGGYANDWLIGDQKTGEIARLENGLKNNIVERTKDGYYVGSNFPVHEKTIREETTFNPNDASNSANARHRCWDELMNQNRGKLNVTLAKKLEGDHYDVVRKRNAGSANTICGHVELDDKGASGDWRSFYPGGASNAKATDSSLAKQMKMWAAAGHPCGMGFKLEPFLSAHPKYAWQREIAGDMPSGPWTLFTTSVPGPNGGYIDRPKAVNVDDKQMGPRNRRRDLDDTLPQPPREKKALN
jgi:hypothetical protein